MREGLDNLWKRLIALPGPLFQRAHLDCGLRGAHWRQEQGRWELVRGDELYAVWQDGAKEPVFTRLAPGQWAIFDLDGTLADTTHREQLALAKDWDAFNAECHKDPLRAAEATLLTAWVAAGHYVAICTSRNDRWRKETVDWLGRYGIKFHELFMRRDEDRRDSVVVKREWYEGFHVGKQVSFVVEDRDKVVDFWRSLGLTCFQCQPGAY